MWFHSSLSLLLKALLHRNRFLLSEEDSDEFQFLRGEKSSLKLSTFFARKKWFDFRIWWNFQVSSLVYSSSRYPFSRIRALKSVEISTNSRNFVGSLIVVFALLPLCYFLLWSLVIFVFVFWKILECRRIGFWFCFVLFWAEQSYYLRVNGGSE